MTHREKLNAVRIQMKAQKLDGFIIPRADEYMGEYVPAGAERLRWLTGFTGSAGFAIVLAHKAAVFSDGRYSIQLRQQVDQGVFTLEDSTKVTAAAWISSHADQKAVIGYDPKLHTPREIQALKDKEITLKALDVNPIDVLWTDRPSAPHSAVMMFPLSFAGIAVADKLDQVAMAIKNAGGQAAMITLPDSIAWALNIRGNDIPHTPVALSSAIIHEDGTLDWFINKDRISSDSLNSFSNRVSLHAPESLPQRLEQLKGKKVLIDGRKSSIWFMQEMAKAGIDAVDVKDPIIPLKARKNPSEQAAMRAAHMRDGVAMTEFLAWLDGAALNDPLDEIGVEQKLEFFRKQSPYYRDSSFDTIAGFGSNGAIVHYRATPATNQTLKAGSFLLLDSGAQYEDGTTDITRTIAIGDVSDDLKTHYTLVLKGHIGLATAKFPAGTTGAMVDSYARAPLWQRGLDYAHGTGHGVGCYLSVHEDSASISPRGHDALEEGMILSNEPGYYREGQYGIRIENLLLVQRDGVCVDTGKVMLSFETLTLAPIDPNGIDFTLLNADEKNWLCTYHKRVREMIGPRVSSHAQNYLDQVFKVYKNQSEGL